jgi:hypothetical protein
MIRDVRRRDFIAGATGIAGGILAGGRRPVHARASAGVKRYALKDVNTTDIPGAIRLGCHSMSSVLNPEDHFIPYFAAWFGQKSKLEFHGWLSEAHVPGRHLNALLAAENVLGVPAPPNVISKLAAAAFFSYSGPIPVPLNRERMNTRLQNFLPHNIREGFHALYALAAFRDDPKARKVAEDSIEFIFSHWCPGQRWEKSYIENLGLRLIESPGPFITGIARSLGPLVKYHRATGSPRALELAVVLKDKALRECFLEDGTWDAARFGTHTHSTTCVLSSLAQLAEFTKDVKLLARVRSFYGNGLKEISDEIGWSTESALPDAERDRGEANNTGDILETALILGRSGDVARYQDAERILRSHLLPSQLRDISMAGAERNPEGKDGLRNVPERLRGGWGFPAPYGHKPVGEKGDVNFNLDIVGGAVGSLCEAYKHIHSYDRSAHRINLLFDFHSDLIDIESPYGRADSCLGIRIKKSGDVFIRKPDWLAPDLGAFRESGLLASVTDGYLVFKSFPENRPVRIKIDLPIRDMALHFRTGSIRARIKGDQIIAMENSGADWTYFPPL